MRVSTRVNNRKCREMNMRAYVFFLFFFQAEDGIRDKLVTGVQTCALPITVNQNTTSDPADQTVCPGATANFSTTASGIGPFTFVWKKGATTLNNGDLGGRVTITTSGSTSSLSISNAQAGDADTYTVEATGACNTAAQSATLSINQSTSASALSDQTVCQGASASF